jgi:choline dehydrogenase/5-(hydroxymethyl)furfural/furfural oxidase
MTRTALATDESGCDVVVIGAGSAGCAVAGALAGRHGLDVVLVEAGPSRPVPAGPDTFIESARQGHHVDHRMALGPRRQVDYRVGAGVGGSGAVNAMLASPGRPEDFDRWEQEHGCSGWGWRDVAPIFERLPVRPEAPAVSEIGIMGRALLASCDRAEVLPLAWSDGIRRSSDVVCLPEGIASGRLRIRPLSPVRRVLFDSSGAERRACGAELADGSSIRSRAVVVSTGALRTPRILRDSGIDHPMLGRQVMDHPSIMFSRRNRTDPRMSTTFAVPQMPVVVGASIGGGQVLAYDWIEASRHHGGVSMALLDVASTGTSDTDGTSLPDPGLLGDRSDAAAMLDLLNETLSILEEPQLRSRGPYLCDQRGMSATMLRRMGRVGAVAWLRGNVVPLRHIAGGCVMGNHGPLDHRCAARGADNLWVADASVMPRLVAANPNLTVMMIGDKVADHVAEALR